ncbi:multifunctional CCA addition/repair protein [Zeimonas arvi]|uniref:CCA-adding enzyme n=1 Tax=Zeimonas arvi TaxID=2498847 RepID=A0A5C8NW67_9BURK|nr:multifunctional CCA addition/repair protein [Zeimonas arvi]TXL65349.1 multifunctional CCA addition/repair protein [Zeimonas arvi]
MQVYCVGGAVRDELLGLPVRDRDWVVVGATPETLKAQGFQPVGRDFPVFLHPDTREEYALARTERKSGRGYRGFVVQFSPDVTLEDDLKRRDLTINAMARDADGTLIDPWNGLRDLRERVLRHVSEAFGEDPVRILRIARFAARFHDFTIAPETRALMRDMVAQGEADHLVAERVWQELSRGLMETHPSRMIAVLRECGALERIAPELEEVWHEGMAGTLDAAAAAGASLPVRFAVLLHGVAAADDPKRPGHRRDPGERADAIAERLRAPTDCRDVARLVAAELPVLEIADTLDVEGLVRVVERMDGLRRAQRMERVLEACGIVHRNPALARVRLAADAMRAIDAGAIARAGPPKTIRERLHQARVRAVEDALLRAGEPGPSPATTAGSSTSAGSTSDGRTG